MKIEKVENLIANLHGKPEYVIYIKILFMSWISLKKPS